MADENDPEYGRIFLKVPFEERHAARRLGAKRQRHTREWYVRAGTDLAPFERWEPDSRLGRDADFEREAVRLSEEFGWPIEETRAMVYEMVRRAEDKAALAARDRVLKYGSAFDVKDAVYAAWRQARHQFFAERQHLYAQDTPGGKVQQAPAQGTQRKLDDVALGRRFREMIKSIAVSSTLRGDEVHSTLALDHKLESIHSDAWRKSVDPLEGDRAVGEQIRTRTGFAAEGLPRLVTAALNKLRGEAELRPTEVNKRATEAEAEVAVSNPVEETQPIDPVSVAPAPSHHRRDPDGDIDMATFADVADAFEMEEAMRARERDQGVEQSPAEPDARPPEKNADWIKENAQSSKDIADRRGLTDRIESEFAQGKTAAQVTADLDEDLSFLPLVERGTFVIYVRHALGIPSQATEEGKREFEAWKAEYNSRNTISADLPAMHPVEPDTEPGVEPSVPANGDATFADVGEAAAIDDAMRSRGLSGPAAPGKAANDATDTPMLDGSANQSVPNPEKAAQNEPDAKNPANEPTRPVLDTVSEPDLKRLSALRAKDRADAEALLRAQNKPMGKTNDSDGDQTKVDAAGDNHIGVDPASRKPIVKKDGYDVPPQIASRYMVKEGRFWKLEGAQAKPDASPTARPHIEDVGPRLKTQAGDRATIADMLAIAEAKNWDAIVVRGDETFRRNAWIEASLAGFDMKRFKGFKPKESDEALLEVAKREREALTIKAGRSPEPSADQKQAPAGAKPGTAEAKPATAESAGVSAGISGAEHSPNPSAKRADGLSGELLEHGSARFQHKQDASYSYFVRYRDDGGTERTVWGVDLKRAIKASGAKVGDAISLKNQGETAVTVDEPIYDASGKAIGTQPKETQRNTWEVKRAASAAPEPVSTKPEAASFTVAQMREQLTKAVEQLPARQRSELLNRFDARMQAGTEIEARIARGELSRDAGADAIDKRAAELHAAWTAPKAAPTSSPSHGPQTEQQQARGPAPNMV